MPVLDCPVPKKDWDAETAQRNGFSNENEKAAQDAGPWEPAVKRILEHRQLGENWDGFGAKAPTHEVLASAVGLAYLFCERGVAPPDRVAPGVDGSVILEWQFPDGSY